MMYEEINLAPPLDMGRANYQWTKGAWCHSNDLKPKFFQKLPSKWNQK